MVKNQWLLFFGIAVGSLMSGIDFLAIGVAIDPMAQSLEINVATLQWFLTAFAIGNASFLVTSGRLCDLYGRKHIFITGSLLFICSSAAIAASSSPLGIIIARFIQGASSGITTSAAIAILAAIYSPADRTRWIAGLVGTTGLGMVLGPSLGGFLIYQFSWRLVFLINVPLGLLGLLFTLLYMPKLSAQGRDQKLDLWGMILFTVTLVLFTIGISQGQYWGWASLRTWLFFGGSVFALILFLYAERKSSHPLLDHSLFKIRNFLSANAVACCLYFTLTGWILVFGIYLQRAAGMSPQEAGISLLPFGMVVLILSTQIDKIAASIGMKRLITYGSLLGVLAFSGMAATSVYPSYWLLIPCFMLYGGSFVIVNACTMQSALEYIPLQKAGIASGKSMMLRWLSGAIGAAVISTIFISYASKRMMALTSRQFSHETVLQQVITGEKPMSVLPTLFQGESLSLVERLTAQAYHHGLVICMVVLLSFSLLALLISQLGLRGHTQK